MGKLIFIVALVASVLGVLAWRLRRLSAAQRQRDAARKRWVIDSANASRIPLAPDVGAGTPIFGVAPRPMDTPTAPPGPTIAEQAAFFSAEDDPPSSSSFDDSPLPAPARLVMTPDGQMVLTAPPFALRESIVTPAAAVLLRGIAGKLPAGMVLCPRVRLESLVEPTSPVDRDPDDWRQWRRRVRLRSVDAAICRVEPAGWRPMLAIEIDLPPSLAKNSLPDRIVDEVLEAAGLAVVHLSADSTPEQAWTLISTRLDA